MPILIIIAAAAIIKTVMVIPVDEDHLIVTSLTVPLKRRIENGFDLNLHRRFPDRMILILGLQNGVLELGLEAGEEAQRAE